MVKCFHFILILGGLLLVNIDGFSQEKQPFIEAEVLPQNPRLNQQVLYRLRFYRDSHLQRGYFLTPEIPQAIIRLKQNLEPRQVEVQGQRYELVEQQYYLYPQTSGQLKLPAPVFSSQELYIKGKPTILQVRPALKQNDGSSWLIADELSLSEQWQGDMADLQPGSIIEREITLRAKNTLGLFLPEVPLDDIRGIDLQRLPVKLSQQEFKQESNHEIWAERIEKFRYIVQQPGIYTLPKISISYWHNPLGQFQQVYLPKHILRVNPDKQIQHSTTPMTKSSVTKNTTKAAPIEYFNQSLLFEFLYKYLPLIVLLGISLFIVIFYRLPKKIKRRLQLLRLTIQLKSACQNNNPIKVKELLFYSAQLFIQPYPPQSLLALARLTEDSNIQQSLGQLDHVLYANTSVTWQGKQALPLLLKFLHVLATNKTSTQESALLAFWKIQH